MYRLLPVLLLVFAACQSPEAPPPVDESVAEQPAVTAATPAQATVTALPAAATASPVLVYKTPTCGCCSLWVDHLRASGFDVETRDLPSLTAVKDSLGVPMQLGSCHTAVVDGYVVEGHVPAAEIARMLQERPDVRGIAVPGMPLGSPGMEVPGRPADTYDVLSFGDNGTATYANYTGGTRN